MIDMLQEWHAISLDTLAGRLFASYLAGMGLAMISWYRRIEPVRWGVLAVFLFLACRHLRNIPIFLIVSLPLMVELLQDACVRLGTQSLFINLRPIQWSRGATFALGLFLLYFGPDHLQRVWRFGSEPAVAFRQTSYPIEAVEWIQAHRDRVGTRLLHDYQYGGFLLWWLPNEKIFIDGRMPAWRIDDRRIFKDYLDARESDPPRLAVLDKYSIDWILIRRDSILARESRGSGGLFHNRGGGSQRAERSFEDAVGVKAFFRVVTNGQEVSYHSHPIAQKTDFRPWLVCPINRDFRNAISTALSHV
jgi:hypothetical protein